jgi:anti-anti-sigma factor
VPKERRCTAPRSIDYESAATFQTDLETLVDDLGVKTIVVDCRELTFIDSYGFRALLGAQRLLESQGRRLRVANLSPPMRRTFDLVGVTGVLRVNHAT